MIKRLQTMDRRRLDWLENAIITLLALSALFLMSQTGILQAIGGQSGPQTTAGAFSGAQGNLLSRGTPVGFLVQNQYGRHGVLYDQPAADALYSQGGEALLTQTLAAMNRPRTATQEDWRQAVSQSEQWVFCDFLYDISFSCQSGQEKARQFLITIKNHRAEAVYLTTAAGDHYTAGVQEGQVQLPDALGTLAPNGALFAFEDPHLAQALPAAMILTVPAPACPVYTAANPLEALAESQQLALAETLGFNLRATTLYHSADGTVLREGTDTLRLQADGTLTFHGSDSGEIRWQALSQREKDQQIKAEEILDLITGQFPGAGRYLCQSVTALPNGETELLFCYLLSGAQVEQSDVCRFLFREEALVSFELCLRRYEETPETCAVLPLRQAAAAADSLGQQGKELQLCYTDPGGSGPITAGWFVREPQ